MKVAIIGGGLSGLTAGTFLKDVADITVFEKARGVSGRMSTRRAAPYVFDHGAQYFTVRTQSFRDFLQPLEKADSIQSWRARYVKFDGKDIVQTKDWNKEESRFVGVPSMNIIAKNLAKNLKIEIRTQVLTLQRRDKWSLFDENQALLGEFDWVISTAPALQTLELLPQDFAYFPDIKSIKMEPCFSLMLGFSSPVSPQFDAAHVTNSDIAWISVNSCKPGRKKQFGALVIHSSFRYARENIEEDHEKVLQHLCKEASYITGHNLEEAAYKTLHRWRFASSPHKDPNPIFIDKKLKIGVCGDWVCGGRVEGAFISAKNLSQEVRETIA